MSTGKRSCMQSERRRQHAPNHAPPVHHPCSTHSSTRKQTLSCSQLATMTYRYAVQVCRLLSLKDQALSAGSTHSNSYIPRSQADA